MVEYATPNSPEFEEIVEEYLEVLKLEEFVEPPAVDTSDITPS